MVLQHGNQAPQVSPPTRAEASTGGMVKLLSQMIRLPVLALVYTIEVFITSMRGIQSTTDQVLELTIGDGTKTSDNERNLGNQPETEIEKAMSEGASRPNTDGNNQQSRKEQSEMSDIDLDLRGDDLKFVEYDIWFTKSDLETYLADDKEVITYSTTQGDYKGAKRAAYLDALKEDPGKRASKWQKNNYPPENYRVDESGNPDKNGEYFNGLPRDDVDEFMRVEVRLVKRWPRDDQDESDRLKEINQTLKAGITVFPNP